MKSPHFFLTLKGESFLKSNFLFSDLCIEAQQDASANGFAGRLSGGNWTGALILLPLKVLGTSPS